MEYMIDRSLRRGAIPESAWQKTGKMLAQMEGDGKLK